MNRAYIELSVADVSLAGGFILLAGLVSVIFRLRIEKSLLIGAVRTALQLGLAGLALGFVFGLKSLLWVMLLIAVMIFIAAREVLGRLKFSIPGMRIDSLIAMLVSSFAVAVTVTGIVIGADPWWSPPVFIPIMGMILGNSLTGISLSLDRFLSDCSNNRKEIETRLALGATGSEALLPYVRDAIRSGMIPSINAMSIVGIVSLPGMMTGQLLAGADPKDAVLYQIVVMYMLVASTSIGSIITVLLTRRRVMTSDCALRGDL